jgi:hypothetical protein
VKLVDLLGIVCRLQNIEETLAAHFLALVLSRVWMSWPSWVRMWGFRPCSIRPFACSTCPVYPDIVVVTKVIWVLLLVIIELETPMRKTMSCTKLTACLESVLAKGLASIHLENLSIMTSRWDKPPGTFLKGPKRSRPHTAKGHVMGMVWSSWAGVWIYLAKY